MSTTETTGLRSVSDLADAEPEAEDDGTPQLILPGTGSPLSTTVGGKKPTEAVFKMKAVSLPIAGQVQMAKDDEVWVAVLVAIDDVGLRNRRKNREIVGVVRTHIATPIGQPVILDGPPAGVGD